MPGVEILDIHVHIPISAKPVSHKIVGEGSATGCRVSSACDLSVEIKIVSNIPEWVGNEDDGSVISSHCCIRDAT